ncbi:MAG TPA: HlyD family efflux transporter periplasmic adaptor subunit [Allosphingosinicella sp.]
MIQQGQVNAPDIPLFRKEVLEQRANRLHGDVHVAVPLSWQVVGYLLLAALVAAFIFLALASYARVEIASGTIVLDRGVAAVVATRPGVVTAVRVRETQRVEAGAPLVDIRAEENLATGGTAAARILDSLSQQDAELGRQSGQVMAAAAAERSQLAAQIAGLTAELGSLDQQLSVQRDLVASAAKEVELVQEIAKRGYIGRRDVLQREETLMTRRQQLAQLQQLRTAKGTSLAEAQRAIARIRAQAGVEAASLSATRSELVQRRVDAQAGRGYRLAAPVAGTVTALTARIGQTATPQQPLMLIIPDDAAVTAELYVPTSAAGFLEPGQEVRLAIDAFPFQRFGSVSGRIATISRSTIARTDEKGTATPVYLVTVTIDAPWVTAHGRRQKLVPGMTLSARIVTEKQSLLEWLFEPLFAVRGR